MKQSVVLRVHRLRARRKPVFVRTAAVVGRCEYGTVTCSKPSSAAGKAGWKHGQTQEARVIRGPIRIHSVNKVVVTPVKEVRTASSPRLPSSAIKAVDSRSSWSRPRSPTSATCKSEPLRAPTSPARSSQREVAIAQVSGIKDHVDKFGPKNCPPAHLVDSAKYIPSQFQAAKPISEWSQAWPSFKPQDVPSYSVDLEAIFSPSWRSTRVWEYSFKPEVNRSRDVPGGCVHVPIVLAKRLAGAHKDESFGSTGNKFYRAHATVLFAPEPRMIWIGNSLHLCRQDRDVFKIDPAVLGKAPGKTIQSRRFGQVVKVLHLDLLDECYFCDDDVTESELLRGIRSRSSYWAFKVTDEYNLKWQGWEGVMLDPVRVFPGEDEYERRPRLGAWILRDVLGRPCVIRLGRHLFACSQADGYILVEQLLARQAIPSDTPRGMIEVGTPPFIWTSPWSNKDAFVVGGPQTWEHGLLDHPVQLAGKLRNVPGEWTFEYADNGRTRVGSTQQRLLQITWTPHFSKPQVLTDLDKPGAQIKVGTHKWTIKAEVYHTNLDFGRVRLGPYDVPFRAIGGWKRGQRKQYTLHRTRSVLAMKP